LNTTLLRGRALKNVCFVEASAGQRFDPAIQPAYAASVCSQRVQPACATVRPNLGHPMLLPGCTAQAPESTGWKHQLWAVCV
jgi:hypothetical protein